MMDTLQRFRVAAGLALLLVSLAYLMQIASPLRLVGDGPYARDLRQLAVSLGVGDTVRFTGAVPGPFDCFLVQRGVKTLSIRM